jgi:hypothetical protein
VLLARSGGFATCWSFTRIESVGSRQTRSLPFVSDRVINNEGANEPVKHPV